MDVWEAVMMSLPTSIPSRSHDNLQSHGNLGHNCWLQQHWSRPSIPHAYMKTHQCNMNNTMHCGTYCSVYCTVNLLEWCTYDWHTTNTAMYNCTYSGNVNCTYSMVRENRRAVETRFILDGVYGQHVTMQALKGTDWCPSLHAYVQCTNKMIGRSIDIYLYKYK